MTFPWEIDARPDRFPRKKGKGSREAYEQKQRTFRGSRHHSYQKFGHPAWYGEYLKTGHWKEFKARWRAKAKSRKCMICGNSRYELHHITYERIGNELLTDVVPLCRAHHARAHRREKEGKPLLTAHL